MKKYLLRLCFLFSVFQACDCETDGTFDNLDVCNDNGECDCKVNVAGEKCEVCDDGYYGWPACDQGSFHIRFFYSKFSLSNDIGFFVSTE